MKLNTRFRTFTKTFYKDKLGSMVNKEHDKVTTVWLGKRGNVRLTAKHEACHLLCGGQVRH